jgi:hypothetical protein
MAGRHFDDLDAVLEFDTCCRHLKTVSLAVLVDNVPLVRPV